MDILVGSLIMVNLGGIIHSLTTNWVTIVVTTVATGITLYVSKKHQTNAREERLKQAEESVIGVIEEHIIDGKDLSISKFDDLINAAEREHSVPLSENVSKVSLLEDLELKIERSPHLNSDQKEKYTDQIQKFISKIEEKEKAPEVTRTRQEILQSLSKNIENGDTDDALEDVERIKHEISQLEGSPARARTRRFLPRFLIYAIVAFSIWFFIFSQLINLSAFGIPPLVLSAFALACAYMMLRKTIYWHY